MSSGGGVGGQAYEAGWAAGELPTQGPSNCDRTAVLHMGVP